MTQISRQHRLKRFSSSRDPDFPVALSIYLNNVPAEARSSSNEITYWLDRTYREFGDEFIVCGFYVDDEVAGYVQMSLLRKWRIIFFDYLVLHPDYRNLGEYLQLAKLVRDLVEKLRLEFDYLVGEVSFESAGDTPTRNCVRLVRLFKQMAFGVAQCEYRYPPLGQHQSDHGLRAYIVMWSHSRVHEVSRETMCHIMKAIYLEYYARWFSPFAGDLDHYNKVLNNLYHKFERSVEGKAHISVNGIKLPFPANETSRAEPPADVTPLGKPLSIIAAFAVFCSIFFVLQSSTHLNAQELTILFGASLLIFAMAFALCYKHTRQVFFSLVRAVNRSSDRRK